MTIFGKYSSNVKNDVYTLSKGLFIDYVIRIGGRVSQKMTLDDKGGVWEKMTMTGRGCDSRRTMLRFWSVGVGKNFIE